MRLQAQLFVLLAFASPLASSAADGDATLPAAPVEAQAAAPRLSVGSWLNTPPDRQAVAFDAYYNRLYFNAAGEVVGRYNRFQKKFQAGDFRPAQWHNIAASEKAIVEDEFGSTSTSGSSGGGNATLYPIVPYPRGVQSPPEFAQPKPAEIFRRGQTASSSSGRVKVIQAITP